jgi:hypothetical protein
VNADAAQCIRSLRWIHVLVLGLCLIVAVNAQQQQDPSGDDCDPSSDWYCWVEERLNTLESKMNQIVDFMVRMHIHLGVEYLREL